MASICRALFFLTMLFFSSLSAFAETEEASSSALSFDYYKGFCRLAEDIMKEQVQLLHKRHNNTQFSWLINIFHDCFVESCDASLLLESTRRVMSEKGADMNSEMRKFRYIENIFREALEKKCPGDPDLRRPGTLA
ncbi:peroxidase 42-like [Salvia hispanica]|uniref:peroxidase 42-like n=1 Tax=Salvia hispanica TaxID=49212 RepID=UPI0020091BF5|nr:peroxidase 42-like [Salvia hispanica]